MDKYTYAFKVIKFQLYIVNYSTLESTIMFGKYNMLLLTLFISNKR